MRFGIAILLSCLLLGCTSKSQTLPSGMYRASTNDQRVLVQGRQIRFWIVLEESRTNLHKEAFPDHSVWPNGRLQSFPMREAEAVLGVGRFDWSWDGTNILRRNGRTGEIIVFQPSDN